jgi:hypothetical protein
VPGHRVHGSRNRAAVLKSGSFRRDKYKRERERESENEKEKKAAKSYEFGNVSYSAAGPRAVDMFVKTEWSSIVRCHQMTVETEILPKMY